MGLGMRCRLHLFRSAFATARLASACRQHTAVVVRCSGMHLDVSECQPADNRNCGAHSMRPHLCMLSCRRPVQNMHLEPC